MHVSGITPWLRIVHSGDWCLRLALCTPSGACHKRRRRTLSYHHCHINQ